MAGSRPFSPFNSRPLSPLLQRSTTPTKETEATDFDTAEDENALSGKMKAMGRGQQVFCSPGKTFQRLSTASRRSVAASTGEDRARALQGMAQSLYASFGSVQNHTRASGSVPRPATPILRQSTATVEAVSQRTNAEVQTEVERLRTQLAEERKAGEALAATVESLRTELQHKAAELQSAHEEIARLKSAKEQFGDTIGDLRERLSAIDSRLRPLEGSPERQLDASLQLKLSTLGEKLTAEKAELRRDALHLHAYIKELMEIVTLLRRKSSKAPRKQESEKLATEKEKVESR